VLNAVEHGNLEIDFDTKTRAMAQGAYFDLLLARQRDPAYAGRKVKVDVSLNPNRVIFQVEDEGRGFDHESAKARADQANEERLEHGRGIKMTLAIFDLVQYNTRGNRVTLVKFFH
ncbi:MAG TPA: ATP-binding protein, partial [Leptospiraceae bacterium]|nr:ATP-binding protein [Leptospiraceae bacterium]